MRPIPGAYVNTPAPPTANPARRRLFTEASSSGAAATTQLGAAPAPLASTMAPGPEINSGLMTPQAREDLPPVAKAAQVVNQTLQLDDSYPDLDSYCRRKFHLTAFCILFRI